MILVSVALIPRFRLLDLKGSDATELVVKRFEEAVTG